ncbi:MAG: succinylglutamate desuccinylase/aspartoacylase family protein, partial [Bryobacteraceae bacterium]
DLLIDLHSGGVEYHFVPVAGFYGEPVAGNPSFDAARRFGLPYSWQLPPTKGVLSRECWKLGITTVGCEYLGAGQLSETGVSAYVAGILSCLALSGVCSRGEALSPGGGVVIGDWMLATAEGLFRARCRLGDAVAAGDALAEIHSERGAVCQSFVAQGSGRVLGLRSKAYIRSGDWGVLIGSEA